MSVTELVFQLERSWLKALAPRNIDRMSITELVFQLERSWLKELALLRLDTPRRATGSSSTDCNEIRGFLRAGFSEIVCEFLY
jgi:hypothetical protein